MNQGSELRQVFFLGGRVKKADYFWTLELGRIVSYSLNRSTITLLQRFLSRFPNPKLIPRRETWGLGSWSAKDNGNYPIPGRRIQFLGF